MIRYLVGVLLVFFGKDDVSLAHRDTLVKPLEEVVLRRLLETAALNIDTLVKVKNEGL